MAKSQTPPLFLHLHEYAQETAAVISALEAMQSFNAGELAGALLARCYVTAPEPAAAELVA